MKIPGSLWVFVWLKNLVVENYLFLALVIFLLDE
jgi:hypothetical protein